MDFTTGDPAQAAEALKGYAYSLKPRSEGGAGLYGTPKEGPVRAELVADATTLYKKLSAPLRAKYDAAVEDAIKMYNRSWLGDLRMAKTRRRAAASHRPAAAHHVAESDAGRPNRLNHYAGGDLVERRVCADLGSGCAPDGIALTPRARSGMPVFLGALHAVRGGGELLDTVKDRGCFVDMLGGDIGLMLCIVANHYSGGGAVDNVVLIQPVAVPPASRS